jgi:hypothetical protein
MRRLLTLAALAALAVACGAEAEPRPAPAPETQPAPYQAPSAPPSQGLGDVCDPSNGLACVDLARELGAPGSMLTMPRCESDVLGTYRCTILCAIEYGAREPDDRLGAICTALGGTCDDRNVDRYLECR